MYSTIQNSTGHYPKCGIQRDMPHLQIKKGWWFEVPYCKNSGKYPEHAKAVEQK
jgi:hypothetical protein